MPRSKLDPSIIVVVFGLLLFNACSPAFSHQDAPRMRSWDTVMDRNMVRVAESGNALSRYESALEPAQLVELRHVVRGDLGSNSARMVASPSREAETIAEVPAGADVKWLNSCRIEVIVTRTVRYCQFRWKNQSGWLKYDSVGIEGNTATQPKSELVTLSECQRHPYSSRLYFACFVALQAQEKPETCQGSLGSAALCIFGMEPHPCENPRMSQNAVSACKVEFFEFGTDWLKRAHNHSFQSQEQYKRAVAVLENRRYVEEPKKTFPRDRSTDSADEVEKRNFFERTPGTQKEKIDKWLAHLMQKYKDTARKHARESLAIDSLPKWKGIRPGKPSDVSFSSSTPTQIFKMVSQSVYLVLAQDAVPSGNQNVVVQGSAVAVSSSHLLTNCHVILGLGDITVRDPLDGVTFKAIASRADPNSDRCLLEVDRTLRSVRAVRDARSLEVGERVFTIGNPKGLSLTLGEGLISGLREDSDIKVVQTSAPISEGSSGGALVDEQGALVGITTFQVRNGQNLNFAIAASEFWNETPVIQVLEDE